MAIPETGNISIKSAAGSGRSIDAEVASVSSGSLVTLSTNAVVYENVKNSPYGMREFEGYTHTLNMTMTETQYARKASDGHMYDSVAADTYGMGFSSLISGFEHRFFGYTSGSNYNILWSIREAFSGLGNYYNSSGTATTGSHTAWYSVANYRFDSPATAPTTIKLNCSASTSTSGSGGISFNATQYNGYMGASANLNPTGTAESWNPSYMTYEKQWQSGAECADYFAESTDTFSVTFGRSGYYDITGQSYKTFVDHHHDQVGPC
tara:strand:- start:90 stop:884 length:795 start_codon:yes stop_codon:yes gene_type:complete